MLLLTWEITVPRVAPPSLMSPFVAGNFPPRGLVFDLKVMTRVQEDVQRRDHGCLCTKAFPYYTTVPLGQCLPHPICPHAPLSVFPSSAEIALNGSKKSRAVNS